MFSLNTLARDVLLKDHHSRQATPTAAFLPCSVERKMSAIRCKIMRNSFQIAMLIYSIVSLGRIYIWGICIKKLAFCICLPFKIFFLKKMLEEQGKPQMVIKVRPSYITFHPPTHNSRFRKLVRLTCFSLNVQLFRIFPNNIHISGNPGCATCYCFLLFLLSSSTTTSLPEARSLFPLLICMKA